MHNPQAPKDGTLMEQSQRLAQDAASLLADTNATVDDVKTLALSALENQPYLVLGGAAFVGYLLAGGLASPLTSLALRTGGRYLLAHLYRSVTSMILPGAGGRAVR